MLNYIEKLLKYLIGIIMFLITAMILAQVISRYVFNFSFSWTEELARFLVVWLVFIGMPVAVRNSIQLSLGVNLLTILPKRIKFLTNLLLDLIIFFSFCCIIKNGYLFAIKSTTSMAMSMPISLFYLYISVPVCVTLTVVFIIEKIYKQIKFFKED
jgi:TRAP-type C4-dicarboxylate transport system permease small subunit